MSALVGRALAYMLSELGRASDLKLLLVIVYALGSSLVPPLTREGTLTLHFVHALAWTLFHSFGLGLVLRGQSQSKFLVRHFLKNYHYPSGDGGKGAIQEAFLNWKSVYNLSMCMSYGELFTQRPACDTLT